MGINFNGVALGDTCDSVKFNGSPVEIVKFNGVEVWNCLVAACPGPPDGVQIEVRATDLRLYWLAKGGAASYNVYNAVDDTLLGNTTDTEYVFDTGTEDTVYTFYVTTVPTDTVNCSESEPSLDVSATYPIPPVTCPITPTGFTSSNSGIDINSSWDAMDLTSGYNIYDGTTLIEGNIQGTTHTFTGAAGTTYNMNVTGIPTDIAGCGDETLPTDSIPVTTPINIPGPPTSIVAEDCSTDIGITINWAGPGPNFRLREGGVVIYEGPDTTLTPIGIGGYVETYSVTCYNEAGESASISDIGSVSPGPVTAVTLTAVGVDLVASWTPGVGSGSTSVSLIGPENKYLCSTGSTTTFTNMIPGTYTLNCSPYGSSACTGCIGVGGSDTAEIIVPSGNEEFTTPGDHIWTCPTGVTSVTATIVGAGGGAGGGGGGEYQGIGGDGHSGQGGQGGSQGSTNSTTVSVTPGNMYNVHIDTGGSGGGGGNDGVSGNPNGETGDHGSNGGNSSFISYIGNGGAGGIGGQGGNGVNGPTPGYPGESSPYGTGGIGGSSGGSYGGDAIGNTAGGGGGAGGGGSQEGGNGGVGAPGYVLIEWG